MEPTASEIARPWFVYLLRVGTHECECKQAHVYVGVTHNPKMRFSQHRSLAKHPRRNQPVLYRVMRAHPEATWEFKVIASEVTFDQAQYLERAAIAALNHDCLNRMPGGRMHNPGAARTERFTIPVTRSELEQLCNRSRTSSLRGFVRSRLLRPNPCVSSAPNASPATESKPSERVVVILRKQELARLQAEAERYQMPIVQLARNRLQLA